MQHFPAPHRVSAEQEDYPAAGYILKYSICITSSLRSVSVRVVGDCTYYYSYRYLQLPMNVNRCIHRIQLHSPAGPSDQQPSRSPNPSAPHNSRHKKHPTLRLKSKPALYYTLIGAPPRQGWPPRPRQTQRYSNRGRSADP